MTPFLPGSTIGILGGGQLGRMMILEGRKLGYNFAVIDPDPNCPAAAICDIMIASPFTDKLALEQLSRVSDVVTYEFEGVPLSSVHWLERHSRIFPRSRVLEVCQNRALEKTFLRENGFPHVPFVEVNNGRDLCKGLESFGFPSVLKSAFWGYDGKGQMKITEGVEDFDELFDKAGHSSAILEKWIEYELECSVIVARSTNGEEALFPVAENHHHNHILDYSVVPARLPKSILAKAREIALQIARRLDVIGLLSVEFFVTADGEILVNEMAPRPHNSGHYTMDSCDTCQFEQAIRSVCGLPLGKPDLRNAVVMKNLMGDHWNGETEPDWGRLLAVDPGVKLHLYQKQSARKGRKMGHINCVAETPHAALHLAEAVNACLLREDDTSEKPELNESLLEQATLS